MTEEMPETLETDVPQPAVEVEVTPQESPVSVLEPASDFDPNKALVGIAVDHGLAISFSRAWNNVRFLKSVTLAPVHGTPITNVDLHITITSLGHQINKPWNHFIKLLTPETGRISDIQLNIEFDSAQLIEIEQLQQGLVVVEAFSEGMLVGKSESKIKILPANAWTWSRPIKQNAASLATFVNPFDPAIDELIAEATPRLRAMGIDGWSGYQGMAGDYKGIAEKVDKMVQALYETLCARDIKYIDPPPSWEMAPNDDMNHGQRIRTPTEVINGRFGTCLDTSITFAALLEKIGLHAFLILIPGHAQVGYWRLRDAFPDYVSDVRKMQAIAKQQAEGVGRPLSLLESTEFASSNPSPFSQQHQIAMENLLSTNVLVENASAQKESEERSAVIDIPKARGVGGVGILPTKRTRSDGTIEIVSPTIQALTMDDIRSRLDNLEPSSRATMPNETFPPRVKQWRNSLLDLSANNPLIALKKTALPIAIPSQGLASIEDLIQSGQELELASMQSALQAGLLSPEYNFRDHGVFADERNVNLLNNILGQSSTLLVDEKGAKFSTALQKLVTAHRNSIEESGHNDLFLALGTLDWQTQDPSNPKRYKAPLFLVPIVIKSFNKSRNFKIAIDPSSSVVPNYSLIEMLDTKFDFKLPKLENPDLDNFGIDIDGTLSYISNRIIEEKHDFFVDESAHIGTFDFSTYRLWRDLTDNWKKFEERPLVKHLIHTPNNEYQGNSEILIDEDADLDSLSSELPISVDGTQAKAIHDAMSGKSLIIEGPPGTGKSQTITNLLVKAIKDGKRVLFVAEKAVAVDVVVQRLSSIGMDSFFLDLHNKAARPSAVRDQIQAAIARTSYPDQNGLEVARRAQAQAIVPLKNFPTQIHARGKFGESAYSSNDILMSITEGPKLTVTAEFLSTITREQLEGFVAKLDHVPDAGSKSGSARVNRWSHSTVVNEEFTDEKRDEITALARIIHDLAATLPGTSTWDLCRSISANQFLALGRSLATTPPALSSVEAHNTGLAKESMAKLITYIDQLKESAGSNPHTDPKILDMPTDQLLSQLIEARDSFVIGRSKKINQVLERFNSYFATPVTDVAKLELNVLPHLKQIIEFAQFVKNNALAQPGIMLPITWNPLNSEDTQILLSQKSQLDSWSQVLIGEDQATLAMRKFVQAVDSQGIKLVNDLTSSLEKLFSLTHATEESLQLWSGSLKMGEHFIEDANYWLEDARDIGFANLNRWTLVYSLVEPLVANGAKAAALEILSEAVPFYESSNAFRRAFLEVVRLRQMREQGLETFDGPNHDRNITEYNRSLAEIRKFLPEQYAYDLINARGFDATVSTGAVGELARELNKSRGQKPVRALLKSYWKVLNRITPCVLASPSSVALFLDPELEPFDLVIFDEASQIKVPHAIGAIGRAKAAIIVGDSRQMPPSVNVGMQSKEVEIYEDDEDYLAPPDEESILSEGVRSGLPQSWLSWHYRSEDESLIAFSNQRYYEGQLSSFPSPSKTRSNKGLSFIATKGHFYREKDKEKLDPETGEIAQIRTNPVEARAVVEEITRRLNDPIDSKYSILVVTLNSQQATLIINLLADSQDERVQQALIADTFEPLMVKALEQVQGSERDVVLLSIGFSRDENGYLPGTFGPIIQKNGHRRLNVAVTRARRQVVVYCSFEPSELANKSQARGLIDLQEFLTIAQLQDDSLVATSNPVDAIDRHREKIAQRLRDRGYNVETMVGASDFKVDIAIMHPKDPEIRILGILLDNGPWNRRKTVIDRDTLPPEVLMSKMGWAAVERIWLPSWLKDPDGEISRIEIATKIAVAKKDSEVEEEPEPLPPITKQSAAPTVASSSPVEQKPVTSAPTPQTNPQPTAPVNNDGLDYWKPWEIEIIGGKWQIDYLPSPRSEQAVQAAMLEILQIESPIEPMRAAKLVGQAYGLSSMFEKRANEILAVHVPGTVRDAEGFIYLESQDPNNGWTGWRATRDGDSRKISEVSLPEIVNGMRHLAIKGLGVSEEELLKDAALLFGTKRLTDVTKARMSQALAYGFSKGILQNDGSHIVAG